MEKLKPCPLYNEQISILRHCAELQDCYKCKYQYTNICKSAMARDAADALEAADKRIEELEAQLPKEGEWIEQDDGDSIFFKCSVCGKIQYNVLLEMMQGEYHYCPNCGARMRGEQE